jgi:hypothetical protein
VTICSNSCHHGRIKETLDSMEKKKTQSKMERKMKRNIHNHWNTIHWIVYNVIATKHHAENEQRVELHHWPCHKECTHICSRIKECYGKRSRGHHWLMSTCEAPPVMWMVRRSWRSSRRTWLRWTSCQYIATHCRQASLHEKWVMT